jgi:hypothetical protein
MTTIYTWAELPTLTPSTLSSDDRIFIFDTSANIPKYATIGDVETAMDHVDTAGDTMTGKLNIVLPNAADSLALNAGALEILHGTIPAAPGGAVTTQFTPTLYVSRIEEIADTGSSTGETGPAILGATTATGTQQGVGITGLGYAGPTSLGDIVGVCGFATQSGTVGTKTAYGVFADALVTTAGSGGIGFQGGVRNEASTNYPYDPATLLSGTPFMVGADFTYHSDPARRGMAVVLVRAGDGPVDNGIVIHGTIGYYDIRTDTNSPTILYAGSSSHTNGVDFSAATFSGSPFKSTGFAVNATGNITEAGGAYSQTTPTPTASGGTFTSVSCTVREKKVGKITHCIVNVVVTTVGTATGVILVTVPTTALNVTSGTFGDLDDGSILGTALLNGTTVLITPAGGILNDTYCANFVYESS